MAETRVEITAIDKTAAAFKSVEGGLRSLGRQVLSAQGALLTLAGVGGLGLLVKSAFESGDAAAKLSDRIGITTGRLIGLQHAANLAGVDSDKLTLALRTLNKGVIDAARGGGEAQESLQRLGLSAVQLASLPLDQQFTRIGESLMNMRNINDRNAAAMKIFGSRSSEVLNLFAEGGGALRQAQDDVDKLGVALTRVDAAKLEMANDSMSRAKLAFQGVANTVAVQLAPIITSLATRFVESAKESNGFRDTVIRGMELVSEAVALGANVVQGLRFAWAGLKVVIGVVLDSIVQGLVWVDRTYTDFFNKLANSSVGKVLGIQATEVNQALQLMSEVSADRLAELKGELDTIALEGLPAERIRAWFEEVKKQAESAAQSIAQSRARVTGNSTGFDPVQGEGFGKLEEQLRGRVERLSQSYMSERQVSALHLEQTRMMLDEAFVLDLITKQEQDRLLQEAELQHQATLGNISAQGAIERRKFLELNAVGQTQFVLGQMLQLTQGVSTHSRTMFKINKIAGIANAVINTAQGVTKALSAYPPPLSFAMAALQAAAGLAQINQIKSAQFGSATSAPSVAGGGAVPVQPVGAVSGVASNDEDRARGTTQVQVIIQGNVIGNEEYIDQLVDGIRDRIENRDVVLFGGRSRQAREIVEAV